MRKIKFIECLVLLLVLIIIGSTRNQNTVDEGAVVVKMSYTVPTVESKPAIIVPDLDADAILAKPKYLLPINDTNELLHTLKVNDISNICYKPEELKLVLKDKPVPSVMLGIWFGDVLVDFSEIYSSMKNGNGLFMVADTQGDLPISVDKWESSYTLNIKDSAAYKEIGLLCGYSFDKNGNVCEGVELNDGTDFFLTRVIFDFSLLPKENQTVKVGQDILIENGIARNLRFLSENATNSGVYETENGELLQEVSFLDYPFIITFVMDEERVMKYLRYDYVY